MLGLHGIDSIQKSLLEAFITFTPGRQHDQQFCLLIIGVEILDHPDHLHRSRLIHIRNLHKNLDHTGSVILRVQIFHRLEIHLTGGITGLGTLNHLYQQFGPGVVGGHAADNGQHQEGGFRVLGTVHVLRLQHP